ncbi:MAG: hypothetical protein AB7Q76_01290 [Gammaproteobacteria bacterium]
MVASNEHVFAVWLTIYRVATVGALALAYWLTHRLCLGWALTTLDAVLVVHFAATLVFLEGWSTSDAITAPGALMVLLVLAQATVRYRPALGAYAAGLFLAALLLLHVVTDPSATRDFQHWRGDEAALVAVATATALALFAAAARARRLLTRGMADSLLRATLSRFVPGKLVEELECSPCPVAGDPGIICYGVIRCRRCRGTVGASGRHRLAGRHAMRQIRGERSVGSCGGDAPFVGPAVPSDIVVVSAAAHAPDRRRQFGEGI